MNAQDILESEGHNSGGRCEKCWHDAAIRYAGGQGAYESHVSAYYKVMSEAQDRARRLAGEGT